MKRLALALAFAGCVAPQNFPEPDKSWPSYSGQLRYVTAGRSLIGEFVASAHGDDFHLEFSKGGAVPLLRVARHGALARVEGALARGGWSGAAEKAPAPLRAWVNDVPAAFARTGARETRIEVPGTQPGERFTFMLNR